MIAFGVPLSQYAQGTWTAMSDLPAAPRVSAVGFSLDGKGYIAGGLDVTGTFYNDFWEFDPNTGTWTARSTFETPRARAVGMALGDKGYVGTGMIGDTTAVADWWMYDPLLDSWIQRSNFGGLGRVDAIGFAIGVYCYVGGGLSPNGAPLMDMFQYDPSVDGWTQTADVPAILNGAATFTVGGKAYVVGGRTDVSDVFSNNTYEYDPVADQWTMKAPFPGEPRLYPTGFAIGEKGYVGTGNSGQLNADWYAYEPMTDTWTMVADFPGGARTMATSFAIGDHGYLATGSMANDEYMRDLWQFDPLSTSIAPTGHGVMRSVYPNPSTGMVWVSSTTGGSATITVYDVSGKQVFQQGSNASFNLPIDLSHLSTGTYLVRIQDGQSDHRASLVLEN
ncbi:MAG: T9SS type A sorting domain-containing protein [Bacteroidota bacterium]|nr:T9SS type A sorting domain-containing protein [Bacteroidota bacterium]